MKIILLSGGSGKGLWPLSNEVRSKQFLKYFKDPAGNSESMLQRVYRQIKQAAPDAFVTIATSRQQVSAIYSQLGKEIGVSCEPCRKDTFPAVVLAALYLRDICGVDESETVVVCPVDAFAADDFFKSVIRLGKLVETGSSNLMLIGIPPASPDESYGYIQPGDTNEVSPVIAFEEKPALSQAKDYISKGALWNSGTFAFRLGYILKRASELIDFSEYHDLFLNYESLNAISIDRAVAEHETDIAVLKYTGMWRDIGNWMSLTEAMSDESAESENFKENCSNVHIINELSLPVLAVGLHDVIISVSPEGILVCDRESSCQIKPIVDKLAQQVMVAEKSWGSYQVINIEQDSLAIKVTLNPGHSMNYHSHQKRDEIWVVIAGTGRTIVDGMEQCVNVGDVITMQAGCRHTIIADSQMKLIEIQLGKEISVHDKLKFKLEK